MSACRWRDCPRPRGWRKSIDFDPSVLFRSVDELPLSVRACNLLDRKGVRLVGELALLTPADLRKWREDISPFRPLSKQLIRGMERALDTVGLSLGCRITLWRPVYGTGLDQVTRAQP